MNLKQSADILHYIITSISSCNDEVVFYEIAKISVEEDKLESCMNLDFKISSSIESSAILEKNTLLSQLDFECTITAFLSRVNNLLIFIRGRFDAVSPNITRVISSGNNIDKFPPAINLLSINQLRSIYTTLEILWSWGGIHVYLNSLQADINDGPYPKAILIPASRLRLVQQKILAVMNKKMILKYSRTILSIISCSNFFGMMCERFLKRILLVLISLSASVKTTPNCIEIEVRDESRLILQQLIQCSNTNHSIPKDVLVSELRGFLRGNSWMQSNASNLLSGILLTPGGLEAVVRGSTSGLSEEVVNDTTFLIRLVRILTSVPNLSDQPDLNLSKYISRLALPLIQFLSKSIHNADKTSSRLAAMCIARFVLLDTITTTKEIITRIAAPVLKILPKEYYTFDYLEDTTNNEINLQDCSDRTSHKCPETGEELVHADSDRDRDSDSHIISSEEQLVLSIAMLHSVLTYPPVTAPLIHCLRTSGVGSAVVSLSLLTAASGSGGLVCEVSELLTTSKRYLQSLQKLDDAAAVRELIRIVLLQGGDAKLSVGPKGGLQLTRGVKGSGSSSSEGSSCGVAADTDTDTDTLNELFDIYHRSGPDNQLSLLHRRAKLLCTFLLRVSLATGTGTGSQSPEATGSPQDYNLVSSLFIFVLQSYFSKQLSSRDGSNAGNTSSMTTSPPPPATPPPPPSEEEVEVAATSLSREQSAVLLFEFQNSLDLSYLLYNGMSVLLLLYNCIEAYADYLKDSTPSSYHYEIPLGEIVEEEEAEDEDGEGEVISACMGILATILGLGHRDRPAEEEKLLRKFRAPLQLISLRCKTCSDSSRTISLSQTASDLLLLLLTRGMDTTKIHQDPTAALSSSPSFSALDAEPSLDNRSVFERQLQLVDQHLADLCPGVRAMGVRLLLKTLKEPSELLSPEDLTLAAAALMRLLADQESYVYLAAVHALAFLVDRHRPQVLPCLLRHLGSTSSGLRQRSMLGEALSFWLRRAGDAAPSYVAGIIRICLSTIRECSSKSCRSNSKVQPTACANDNDSSSSSDTNTTSSCTSGSSSDVIYLRQTGLSLLADAIVVSGWAAGNMLYEAVDVAIGVLDMERENHLQDITARRSAAFLLRHILTQFGSKLLQSKQYTHSLQAAYKSLRRHCAVVSQSKSKPNVFRHDEVTLFHLRTALDVLSNIIELEFAPQDLNAWPERIFRIH